MSRDGFKSHSLGSNDLINTGIFNKQTHAQFPNNTLQKNLRE